MSVAALVFGSETIFPENRGTVEPFDCKAAKGAATTKAIATAASVVVCLGAVRMRRESRIASQSRFQLIRPRHGDGGTLRNLRHAH